MNRSHGLGPLFRALYLVALVAAGFGVGRPADAAAITRGPYLQRGSDTGIVVRWRTNLPSDTLLRYGTLDCLETVVVDPVLVTEHEVVLTGLEPATQYCYAVGSTTELLAGNDGTHLFKTAPMTGTAQPTRIWVLGDSGTANAAARAVRDAYEAYAGTQPTDLWLMLGDNAYPLGTDAEYQAAVFNIYPEMLRRSVLWAALGNHDTPGNPNWPYFDIFTLPTAGEAGGLASGTEHYYAFDYGNIHFVVLDSVFSGRLAGSPMLTWLEADLANTSQDWIVALWHHPPYSKGSHDSDNLNGLDLQLQEMRENAVVLLEDYSVDLVLSGHSHSYERSFLLDGHYGDSTSFVASMKLDAGNGREDGDGAYGKAPRSGVPYGSAPGDGAVYTVAGSSGLISGGALNHPAMFVSLNVLGSVVLDIDGNRLDLAFLDSAGTIRDYFTLVKACPDADSDGDGICDFRDDCPLDPDNDVDQDGVCGDVDVCPDVADPDQTNSDNDSHGDACDNCPLDPDNDVDQDGVCGDVDICPDAADPEQTNSDNDGLGDACDNCPFRNNQGQMDNDGDGHGNPCDNCVNDFNPDQTDLDGDGKGDVCDLDPGTDTDGDGVDNVDDCAPLTRGVAAPPGPVGATLRLGKVAGGARLVWLRGEQGHASNVYRRLTGQATSPGFVCLAAELAGTAQIDPDLPLPGQLFLYLVTARNVCGEGSAGQDSEGAERGGWPACPPTANDDDADGILNTADNCPTVSNPSQSDVDQDFIGDACE